MNNLGKKALTDLAVRLAKNLLSKLVAIATSSWISLKEKLVDKELWEQKKDSL